MLNKSTIPVFLPELPDLELYKRELEKIWNSKIISNNGEYARELENEIQSYLGNHRARVVVSGDIGLTIALQSLGIESGGEVIVPSFTFNSTVNSIAWNHLTPVFADINLGSFCIDVKDVESKITSRTKAILATHVFGNPCDISSLKKLASRHSLFLLFDSAHALGSIYQGEKIGGQSDIDVFSLSGTKLVTSGEGGIIVAKDDNLLSKIDYIRNYGFQKDYNSHFLGLNGKMSELHAALGLLSIPRIDLVVAQRNRIAQEYKRRLSEVPVIKFQEVRGGDLCSYKDFSILAPKRDQLALFLENNGVMTKKYFFPVHKMDYFTNKDLKLSTTDFVAENILCLPIFNLISEEQIETVCKLIVAFYEGRHE